MYTSFFKRKTENSALVKYIKTGPAEQVLKWGGGGGGLKGTRKREALVGGDQGHASAKNFGCKSSKMGGKCLKNWSSYMFVK